MIHIYTDGSCQGNPGSGGWAALIVDEGNVQALSGKEGGTTNNRMEQTAAIKALESLPIGAQVTLYSDSQYVVRTMTRGWKRRANTDLWAILDELVQGRRVRWEWVQGHAGHPQNEFVNALAGWEAGVLRTRPRLEDFVGGAATQTAAPADADVEKREGSRASPGLTHLDAQGRARMVDVGGKPETEREATAVGEVVMSPDTLTLVQAGGLEKGDVFATARLAGIMGAKETPRLIPLCHPIPLTQVAVEFEVDEARSAIQITATVKTMARTGVEMEALTAVTVAALTIYDMAKASDRAMRIEGVRLVRKRGGRSGEIHLE
jgi:cyclic pyranopterin phosphate synthase